MEHKIQENMEVDEQEETRAIPDEVHYRDFQIESGDRESRTVKMSVSSEAPVTRNWGGVEGIEVLDHSPDSIDLTRFERGAAPLLLDHDPTKQIGVIDSIRLDQSQRNLRATARFGGFFSPPQMERVGPLGILVHQMICYLESRTETVNLWQYVLLEK